MDDCLQTDFCTSSVIAVFKGKTNEHKPQTDIVDDKSVFIQFSLVALENSINWINFPSKISVNGVNNLTHV